MAEISTKPYLIRAIYEWCTDNGYRPYIAVAVDDRTIVPREFVRNGEIVLNVSAMATNGLQIGNELVQFEARFGGVPRQVSIPVENISAIFAQENGHGMAFDVPKAPGLKPVDAQPGGDGDGVSTALGQDATPAAEAGSDAAGSLSQADGATASDGRTVGATDDAPVPAGASAPPAARAPSRRRRPKLAAVPTPTPSDSTTPVAAPATPAATGEAAAVPANGAGASAAADASGNRASSGDDQPPPPPAGRPRLTRVK